MELEFLDYTGLTLYDRLIKGYVDEGDATVASSITSQEERLLGLEGSVSGLTKVSNKLRGRIEKILTTLDEGVAIIEQLSGDTYYVTDEPMSGDTHTLVTSDGIYWALRGRTAYVECNDVGRTGDPNIVIDCKGYNPMDGGGYMVAKMDFSLHTSEYTYLNINETGNYRLYFNGKPANENNSWAVGEPINIWFDGSTYQSTHAFSVNKASEIMYSGDVTLKDKLDAIDSQTSGLSNQITTLSANTTNAINSLSGATNTAINNLSAATNTAINNLSAATTSAITALSGVTKAELDRVEGKVDVNAAAINALSLGAKVAASVSPACIYKGSGTTVTVTGTFSPNTITANTISILDGGPSGTLIKSGSTVNTISSASTYTLTDNTHTFSAVAMYEGAKFMNSVSLQARHPIYCGFCNTNGDTIVYSNIENEAHRLSPRTSAAGTYAATATGANQRYCILVPSDIGNLTNFTMGGAPYVMVQESTTFDNIQYKVYRSGALYNTGAEVNIIAS